MTPHQIEILMRANQQALASGHGSKRSVYESAAAELGMSIASVYRNIDKLVIKPERKKRADAGRCALTRTEAEKLSAWLMTQYRQNKKKLGSIELALTQLRKAGEITAARIDEATGEFKPLSPNTVARALRSYGLHPDQLRRPTPSISQRSAHANDVWQIDASISTLFYAPQGGIQDMSPAEFYKNKPGNFEKIKKQRLTRYVVTDHTSGAIFVWYVAGGESIANLGASFLEAMREKVGESPYGVPFYLYFDAGSAATKTFRRFLDALGIQPVVHAVGNARATGQVECAHNIVECNFEVGFKQSKPSSIDWINEQVRRWCKWYNATKVHSRHGRTRLAKWMEITAAQLRLVDVDLARELLTREPVLAMVNDNLRVKFKGEQYDVSVVPEVRIREKLAITVNPLQPNAAWAVLYAEGKEVLFPLSRVERNADGFEVDAPLIGREIRQPTETQIDKNRKAIARKTYDAATDEQAEKAAKAKELPLGGRVDPYAYLDDLPDVAVLPRLGTEHNVNRHSHTEEVLLSHPQAALRIKQNVPDWSADHYAKLVKQYPGGVPESACDEIARRWSAPQPHTLKIIKGGDASC